MELIPTLGKVLANFIPPSSSSISSLLPSLFLSSLYYVRVSNSNDKEEEYKEKIIYRFGYNGYLRLLQSLAYIAEHSRFNTPNFLAGMVAGTWIRSILPSSHEGYLVEDLDMILLRYRMDDRLGSFKLIEIKHTNTDTTNSNRGSTIHHHNRLRKAQELTFGLMDHILKRSSRYEGFYLIRFSASATTSTDSMMAVEDANTITVNDIPVSRNELRDFLLGRKYIEPYSFEFERYEVSPS